MNEATFHRGMKLMAATWPQRNPTPETAAAYWLVLNKLDDSVFEAAVTACLESCTYYPVPAEIREKAKEILGKNKLIPAVGELAWAEVLRLIHFWSPDNGWCAPARLGDDGKVVWGTVGEPNGYYGAPSPLDKLTQRAIDAVGGLHRICDATDHDLGFIRQEFLSVYNHQWEQEIAYGTNLLSQPLPQLLEAKR